MPRISRGVRACRFVCVCARLLFELTCGIGGVDGNDVGGGSAMKVHYHTQCAHSTRARRYTPHIGARLHARFTGNNNGNQAMRPSREHSCQFYVPPYGIKSAASCLCSLHCWGRANGASRFLLGLIVTPWVAIVCVCALCTATG